MDYLLESLGGGAPRRQLPLPQQPMQGGGGGGSRHPLYRQSCAEKCGAKSKLPSVGSPPRCVAPTQFAASDRYDADSSKRQQNDPMSTRPCNCGGATVPGVGRAPAIPSVDTSVDTSVEQQWPYSENATKAKVQCAEKCGAKAKLSSFGSPPHCVGPTQFAAIKKFDADSSKQQQNDLTSTRPCCCGGATVPGVGIVPTLPSVETSVEQQRSYPENATKVKVQCKCTPKSKISPVGSPKRFADTTPSAVTDMYEADSSKRRQDNLTTRSSKKCHCRGATAPGLESANIQVKEVMNLPPGVTFQGQRDETADRTFLNNFEEVEQLIQEEGDDVEIALSLQNQLALPQTSDGVGQPEHSGNTLNSSMTGSPCQCDEYESDDDVSPEVAAAMMHSEEQGILMGAAPSRVFNALFLDDEKDLIAITSAAPFHPQNVVVPASVDDMPYTSSAEDLVALASTIRGEEPLPRGSIFSDTVKQRGAYSSVLEEASKPNEAIGSSENISRSSLPCGETIEYVLEATSTPDHFSRVQLRGSTSPEWFPGFFEALPSINGITTVCRDPGTVLEDAWKTLQSTKA